MTFLKRYWKTLLVAAAILYLSLWKQPSFKLPDFDHADKWGHLLMYGGLAFVAHWELFLARVRQGKQWLFGLVMPVAYGGIIEILQEQFFPPRSGEWADWLADGVGAALGFLVFPLAWMLWERISNQPRKPSSND